MNIYDCFMYFDEDLILDLRLNYLSKYVHKFIIVESTYNHNGAKKNFNLIKKNLKNLRIKLFIFLQIKFQRVFKISMIKTLNVKSLINIL